MTNAVATPRYRPGRTRRELLVPETAPPAPRATQGVTPPIAVIALNRMGFGPRPGDIEAFNALGANDDARLAEYVWQQLHPGPDDQDTEYWLRRNGLGGHPNPGFVTLGLTLTQLWQTYEQNSPPPPAGSGSGRPVEEVRLDTYLRMVHSKWQLREVLADFWHNHFNVYGFENITQETFVHWNRDVIRPNIFGNFRDFLGDVAQSVTMLYYLDNYTNTVAGPNENWARELFELHTLGAENYLGVGAQAGVGNWPGNPVWPAGLPGAGTPIPAGYVDDDVYEVGRCFTGWGRDGNTGAFQYSSGNHDNFQKSVLSKGVVNIPQGGEINDGNAVLDLLAAHPGVGRHIAGKLCRRLIGDNVAQSLIDQVGATFTAQRNAPDQLKQVYIQILTSNEFKTTWGDKIKRPVDYSVSILRAGYAYWNFGYTNQNPLTVESDMSNFLSRQSRTGHNLFARVPPDGYPDREAPWTGTNSRLQCWRLASWLIDQDLDGQSNTDDFRLDVIAQTYNAFGTQSLTSNQLVDYWIWRMYGRTIDPAERAELVDFMRQGNSANLALNLGTSSSLRARLRSLVALTCMLPEFFLK
jgi:uncharacterized protein (DUF1800 family)